MLRWKLVFSAVPRQFFVFEYSCVPIRLLNCRTDAGYLLFVTKHKMQEILCTFNVFVTSLLCEHVLWSSGMIQESLAIADKPERHESMPKIAQIRRAYNVVADNTGVYSYVYLLLRPKSAKSWEIRNSLKIQTLEFKVIQGHQSWYQSKAHMYFPISH